MSRLISSLAVLLIALLLPLSVGAQEIQGPEVRVEEGQILVSTELVLSDKQIQSISRGISKEITIYIDLYRVWKAWPDEFILGGEFNRTLTCDPVKNEFVVTSLYGDTLREKRFSDCASLLKWALTIKDQPIARTDEVRPARYFVKVTAESRLRKLPPVVGYLLFFVKEKDFKIDESSEPFVIEKRRKRKKR